MFSDVDCITSHYTLFFMFYFILLDPRLKALSETKLKQFRTWFDQRLDDAIAASENNQGQLPEVADGELFAI